MDKLLSFYQQFYGKSFNRHYRPINDKFSVNIDCNGSEQLIQLMRKERIPTNHYIETLNRQDINVKQSAIMDRLFFDFDGYSKDAKLIKEELHDLRKENLNKESSLQAALMEEYQRLLLDEKIAKQPIKEAKHFAESLFNDFDVYPLMFFSGGKGAHLYVLFEPVELINPDKTIETLAEMIKENNKYENMDLAVNKDPTARISRIPYTIHPISGCSVIPFSIDDDYETIINNSINPDVSEINIQNYKMKFDDKLKSFDEAVTIEIEREKKEIERARALKKQNLILKGRNMKLLKGGYDKDKIDLRDIFRQEVSSDVKDYGHYIACKCPFHSDNKPSMLVGEKWFKCEACSTSGNYVDFIMKLLGCSEKDAYIYLMELTQ